MSAGVSYAGMAFNFEIMKNLFCLCILLLIGSMQMSRASDKIEKTTVESPVCRRFGGYTGFERNN